jgi:hypothetical protein
VQCISEGRWTHDVGEYLLVGTAARGDVQHAQSEAPHVTAEALRQHSTAQHSVEVRASTEAVWTVWTVHVRMLHTTVQQATDAWTGARALVCIEACRDEPQPHLHCSVTVRQQLRRRVLKSREGVDTHRPLADDTRAEVPQLDDVTMPHLVRHDVTAVGTLDVVPARDTDDTGLSVTWGC